MSKRIQRSRKKGWRKPEGSVIVDRTSRWGNPYTKADAQEAGYCGSNAFLVENFDDWINGNRDYKTDQRDIILNNISELRGKNLVCFCPLDQPCHADTLMRLANS